MRLFNTLSRKVEDFKPLDDKKVRMYSCGPTVYDHIHIGNLSAFIYADTLKRVLKSTGYEVEHVMNFTDVDDKTIRRSQDKYPDDSPEIALKKLTDEYKRIFMNDTRAIGNNTEDMTFVSAVESIPEMQKLITELHKNGFAYIADDGVYFSIKEYRNSGKKYGQLLELTNSSTSNARINNDEYDKESLHDFALWKLQKDNEPAWPFELDGHQLAGRPGWHIECSAMSVKRLGQPFDIHTGGVDLIFPHHENEIAQSTAGQDKEYANFFVHNEHILVDGKKMSKSLNNFYTLTDIQEKGFDPLAFRLMVLQSHYRNQSNFTWDNLYSSQNSLQYLQDNFSWIYQSGVLAEKPYQNLIAFFEELKQKIKDALQSDVSTPQAIAILHEYADGFATIPASQLDIPAVEDLDNFINDTLGIRILVKEKYDIPNEQKNIIKQRDQARVVKDWDTADKLRDALRKQGLELLKDTEFGSIWYRT